ncbi:ABC transporter permease [Streptomyces polyrhachis]|uniref:ABC transporter permease n=1 Tax=Streptomyces polyrhachis TaxID=1282885 RepID=A0ABW2GMU7_9ACTN
MRTFLSLSRAMALGLLRDRAAVFFTLLFPVMFLALFGMLFKDAGQERADIVQIGRVQILDSLPADARKALAEVMEVDRSSDRAQALKDVRDGDTDAVVWQDGDTLQIRYSAADPVAAGNVRGIFASLVDKANVDATGQPPAYRLRGEQVEDESLEAIQFFTPGLLSWAVAMGAVFGTALGLVNWRKKRILRRLWLAPISPVPVIAARIGTTVAIALVQTAIFLGIATLPYYGLKLSADWWLAVPLVVCGALAFMSVGLLVGAWAKSEEAAQGLAQIIILPMAFLSGAFFPLDAAPGWVRTISEALPMKHLATALESVLSRGGGWGDALPAMGGLLLFAAVLTAIAAKVFRWEAA